MSTDRNLAASNLFCLLVRGSTDPLFLEISHPVAENIEGNWNRMRMDVSPTVSILPVYVDPNDPSDRHSWLWSNQDIVITLKPSVSIREVREAYHLDLVQRHHVAADSNKYVLRCPPDKFILSVLALLEKDARIEEAYLDYSMYIQR